MSQQYKIARVGESGDNAPKPWSGNKGSFIDYKVMLEGQGSTIYTLTKKQDSQPPKQGDEFYADIDQSAQYGPKIKIDWNATRPQGGGGGGGSYRGGGGAGGGSKAPTDPRTMYFAYAKDISVALIAANKIDAKDFDSAFDHIVDKVIAGGDKLLANQGGNVSTPAAAPAPKNDGFGDPGPTPPPAEDNFPGNEPINLDDIPF